MTSERIDPETLAALLDGRLSPEERARVLAVLARSDEAYDDLVEAAALAAGPPAAPRAEAPAAPPDARGGPARPPRRRRGLLALGPLLAAAGIAAIVYTTGPRRDDADGPARVVRLLVPAEGAASVAAAFGPEWDRPAWSVVRGAEAALPPDALAFRLGARFAQLELAFAARDAAAVAGASATLARLAAAVEGGAPVAARVEQLAAGGPGAPAAERDAVARDLRALAARPAWFDAGAWSEAARLAAAGGRAAFFAADGAAMAELRRVLGALDAAPPDERAAAEPLLARLRALAARGAVAPGDLPAVRAALDSTVREGGR